MSKITSGDIDNFYAERECPRYYDDGPIVVCLCGSMRFKTLFDRARKQETMDGKIVVGPEIDLRDEDVILKCNGRVEDLKEMLDNLHIEKITMSHEILVISEGGYIGESTRKEIEYAIMLGKVVRYYEIELNQ